MTIYEIITRLESFYSACRFINVFLGIIVVFVMGLRLAESIKEKQAPRYLMFGMIFIGYVAVVSYGSYRSKSLHNVATESSFLILVLNISVLLLNISTFTSPYTHKYEDTVIPPHSGRDRDDDDHAA